jgi:hypothetical protein
VRVVAADVGQHARRHVEGAGLVIATADACLHRRPFHAVLLEQGQGEQDRDLVKSVGVLRVAQGQRDAVGAHAAFPCGEHIGAADEFAADAEALAVVEEVGTHKGAGLADAAKAQFQKAAGRAFAAGAGHVDQARRVAVGPECGDGVAQQFEPRQLRQRPLHMVDLVDSVVIGKIGWQFVVCDHWFWWCMLHAACVRRRQCSALYTVGAGRGGFGKDGSWPSPSPPICATLDHSTRTACG